MPRLRQTGRVAKVGVAHAHCTGGTVHAGGESLFRARDCFGNGGGRVIGGFDRRCAQQKPQADGLTCAQTQLRRRLGCSKAADPHRRIQRDLAAFDGLESHIEGHHLCQRCRVELGVGIARVQDFTGARIHDHRGIGCCGDTDRSEHQRYRKYA